MPSKPVQFDQDMVGKAAWADFVDASTLHLRGSSTIDQYSRSCAASSSSIVTGMA
jgi:hypothetical protein